MMAFALRSDGWSQIERPDVKGIETLQAARLEVHAMPQIERPDVKGIETNAITVSS